MKRIKILPVAAALLLGVASCNLDRFPHKSIAKEKSLTSVEDARYWNANIRAQLRGAVYGSFIRLSDYQADMVSPSSTFGNRDGVLYTWGVKSDTREVSDIYASYYSNLKNVNEFLTLISSIKANGEAAEKALASYVADAHFVRAYYYAELAKRFAPLYNPATAATELCVPLVLTYNVDDRPSRATQQQVYEQIFKDIAEAKALFAKAGKPVGKPGSMTMNGDALAALEARVYLQMRDYPKALQAAEALIKSGRYPLVAPAESSFEGMWFSDKSTEDILRLYVNKDDEKELPPGVGSYFVAITLGKGDAAYRACQPDWFPTKGIIDLFEDKDLRKWVYFNKSEKVHVSPNVFPAGEVVIVSKYRGNLALAATTADPLWGAKPDARNYPLVLRIAEAYMIAAEAAYKTNNEAAAKQYLNTFRASRGLDPVDGSGDALFTQIKDERTREFAFEGARLWDLKRWEMPMKRTAPQEASKPFLSQVGLTLEIPADHFGFTWPIPHRDMQTNPNLAGQQNKGY
ncbi:RagB/SusD family nutrient uptake outer membrane protein [Porphyromonas sp. COT-239 OH1446]|uniref:RagB/SusD family nutrient uptake outer membrane protein n=1 Tax=Porphyromonas sp. COT-239 OH1446 TaxID=1515613 RepID=UPI0009DCED91|nr:RagB/SusD family nutrient uptake outer membrane protein [Porphyromonas sp. COT-239 OH1446]